jgi:hypothetical protein
MTGYGLTVFSGFKVERFSVRVIDVLENFLPKQDLFLVRVDHPVLRKTNVVGGMSGSPIYLQGKLAGALAYGWRFSKEPIAGITPIANMLDLLKRKPRGPSKAGYASAPMSSTRHGRTRMARIIGRLDGRRAWWKLPFARAPRGSTASLAPVAVPLNVAGFSRDAMPLLRDAFADYGFEPVQGGGTGRAQGPARYQTGGSVGVRLVSGDMALTGTGTVTWTDPGGRRVLGFGHRMFNAGEIYLPAVTARVNHTLASVSRSFKLSSPAREIGSLVQDRQAGILVDTGKKIGTVPMSVTMRFQGRKRTFKARLARHRLLTPTLASTVLSSAISEAVPDVANVTMQVITRFTVRGYPQVTLKDHLFADTGARIAAVLFSRGISALRKVLNNPFAPAHVERLDMDVAVKFAREVVQIKGLRTSSSRVEPGSRINLVVSFKPFAGKEFTKTYPVTIPRSLAGSLLKVEAASGKLVTPDRAPPQDLRQFLEDLDLRYPARSVVLSLSTPTQGVKLHGKVIKDLPTSVIDALNTGTQVRDGAIFQTVSRDVHGTRSLITGKKSLRIRVTSEVTQ